MEVEQKQGDLVQQFVLLASNARGRAAVELITHATSHPQLFAFSELLSSPHIAELKGTEHSSALDLLRLFAHGTWSDYKNNAQMLPPLDTQQVLKLKQLTVMTLAETAKVLPYDLLMQQLDISNVRELEDLLINDCMYSGIVRGKLDQRRRCFEVQFAAGRDLRPGQLDNMISTLANWLGSSDNLLLTIQEKIKWADSMSEQDRRHKKEVEDKAEEMRKSIKAEMELRGQQDVVYAEAGALVMDYVEEDRSRPKSWFVITLLKLEDSHILEMFVTIKFFCAGLLSGGPMGGMMGTQKALAAHRYFRQHFRSQGTSQFLGIMLGAVLSLLEVDSVLRTLSTIFIAFIAVGASEPCNSRLHG